MFLLYLAFISAALYALLIRGWLWKITIVLFSIVGMYCCLTTYLPDSRHILLTVGGYHFSWAQVIPATVVLLALITYRRKQ